MTPQHVISQLLESDSKSLKNVEFLKKIILTAYLGRLRVNGQSPDNQISLANYLFDQERIIFDFNRVSDLKKEMFQKWLLQSANKKNNEKAYGNFAVNEYRGFTSEKQLGFWGTLKRRIRKEYTEHWKIRDLDLTLHYQLLGIDLCHGQQGTLIGFKQFLVPPSGTKYKSAENHQFEPLRNTKRVYITDKLVDQLLNLNWSTLKFESICKGPHPQAITVSNYENRYKKMLEYRTIQNYKGSNSLFSKIWNWILSWFRSEPKPTSEKPKQIKPKLTFLDEDENTNIYQRENSEVLVREKRPNIENLVFCGGGAKIFAHIGVWKALNEVKIEPKKFAGSSAGAIIGLMCYLGYSAEKIAELFKNFKKEHLIYYDINRKGLSDPKAIKTALDYAIALKVKEIVTRYKLPYLKGEITFATLEALRLKCPGCGLGEELIVTATNKRLRQTSYFSFSKTPTMEISEAVKISASFPIVFRDTKIDGDDYNDGGILNNFPTDAFHMDDTTFLESEYGNNMKTLAVQFDNGTERATVDRVMDRVHRENFFLNWIYSLITGVKDPASGWEQDRMKLRKYAAQSIIVDIGTTSSTGFSVEESSQSELIQNGYRAARSYLQARYAQKADGPYKNKETMYTTFDSLEELLTYCCYKGNKYWFDRISDLVKNSTAPNKPALMRQAQKLKTLYFNSNDNDTAMSKPTSPTFFGNTSITTATLTFNSNSSCGHHEVFLALYPIFLKLTPKFFKNIKDHDMLIRARHSITSDAPLDCLEYLSQIKEESHVLFHIFKVLISELKNEYEKKSVVKAHVQRIFDALNRVERLINHNEDSYNPEFYDHWDLNSSHIIKNLDQLDTKSPNLFQLYKSLKEPCELQGSFDQKHYELEQEPSESQLKVCY